MHNEQTQYFFLNDLRDWIRSGKSKEILDDLRSYYPDQYEEFMRAVSNHNTHKQLAALLQEKK